MCDKQIQGLAYEATSPREAQLQEYLNGDFWGTVGSWMWIAMESDFLGTTSFLGLQ